MLKEFFKSHPFFGALFSALLLYLSFPNHLYSYGFAFLAWFFAVPLMLALEDVTFTRRLKYGFLFSVFAYGGIASWVMPVHFWGYVVFVGVHMLQPIIFALFYRTEFENKVVAICFPGALWAALEFLRTILLGGFSWTLGYSQSFYPAVIQISNLAGSYGISFVLMAVNVCFYKILKEPPRRFFYFAGCLAALAVVFFYGTISMRLSSFKQPRESVEVCTIQPNILMQNVWDGESIQRAVDRQIVLTEQCFKQGNPDLVVWPETAVVDDFLQEPSLRGKIFRTVQESGKSFLIGSARFDARGAAYNSAVLLDEEGNTAYIYDKRFLIPFSEYFPMRRYLKFLVKVFGIHPFNFSAGKTAGVFPFDPPFGLAICSESSYPGLIRGLVRQGAQFGIVIANDAWLSLKPGLIMHAQNIAMRAAENRRPIIQGTNTGWSLSADRFGRLHSQDKGLRFNERRIYLSKIYPNQARTVYNQIGDVFSVFCLIFVLVVFIKQQKNSS